MIGLVSIHHHLSSVFALLVSSMRHAPFVSAIQCSHESGKKAPRSHCPFFPRCAALRCGLHACSTVDSDDFAIHPFAILRSQETDDAGDVDGLTYSSDWGPCFCVLFGRKRDVSMLFSQRRKGEKKKKPTSSTSSSDNFSPPGIYSLQTA